MPECYRAAVLPQDVVVLGSSARSFVRADAFLYPEGAGRVTIWREGAQYHIGLWNVPGHRWQRMYYSIPSRLFPVCSVCECKCA